MKKVVLSDRFYVPLNYTDSKFQTNLANFFTHEISRYISPAFCSSCYQEHGYDPPCEDGKSCPYSTKTLLMYDRLYRKDRKTLALWRGDLNLINKLFGSSFYVIDKRATPIIAQNPIKFDKDFELYYFQKKAIAQWAGSGCGGMIQAPARSGKTIIGAYIAARLGLKTLILCHQYELVDQFYATFKKFTDGADISKFQPKARVVKAVGGNVVDLVERNVDVIISTYQTFITEKGQRRLKDIRNAFGLLIIDECHLASSNCFSQVVTKFNSFLKLGLTATPNRKDGRDILAKYAIGPVVSHVTPPQLTGKSYMMYTDVSPGQWTHWPTLISRLVKSKTRNKKIVNTALKDLKEGRNIIMLTDRRKHAEAIVKLLKQKGVKQVHLFYGGLPNGKQILEKARQNKTKVLVATRKKAQFGLDIPPLDTYYCLTPINNEHNFYQEFSRIRTPHEDKHEPLVRVFVDKSNACRSCAKTCKKVLIREGFEVQQGIAKLGRSKATTTKNYGRSPLWDKFSILPD